MIRSRRGKLLSVLSLILFGLFGRCAHAEPWDPAASDYSGNAGVTLYVSKLGDGSDGLSWATAFTTIQEALNHVPDAKGGHRVIVRPDTYIEANLFVPHPGAPGAYNLLVGDADARFGSGTKGRVVIDCGDDKGFKSYDWWGPIRSNSQGWSPEHKEPTFSAIGWDRWVLRNFYVTGGDGGLFWDCTNRIEPFTVVVEDCVSIGRAFGGGVASCLSRPDEPITFRRCKLWSLDEWGDTAGLYVRVENPAMPERPDVIVEDCTLVSPQCALKGGNYGFHTYMRVAVRRSQLIALNFSQPAGTPTDGVVQSVQNGKYLHVDFEDSTLMGYRVFGVKVDKDSAKDIGYSAKGAVNAYVQWTQGAPEGMLRLGHWPPEAFEAISMPPAPDPRPAMTDEKVVLRDICEVSPIVWKGRALLLVCRRPATGGTVKDYYLTINDAESNEEIARFGEGYSLASAFVQGDTIGVTASRFADENWNDVTLFTSKDLQHWDRRVAITQDAGEHLFNSSVCASPDGFVMAYESNDPAYPAFTVKFAQSKDLQSWSKLPEATFGTDRYTACPTIRYADGHYYVMYLEQRAPRWFFETYITRSADLKTWYRSAMNPVLTPRALDDSINTSDMDLAEVDGKTQLYYAVGDQRTWMNVKRRTYAGTMGEFLKSWFPSEGIRDVGDMPGYRARMAAQAKSERQTWFRDAKFGMFIHWGPFAALGTDPKPPFNYFDMKADASKRPAYVKYAEGFAPKAFDAAGWMDIAKRAGMKYVVFTSKHHDGYTLFDSALTNYDSMDQAPHADYVRSLSEAARAAGLKFGVYYSMLDWHEPGYASDFPGYVERYLFGQVRELCTKYGPMDCLWFDGEWDQPAAAWRAPELVKMIRQLQPNALINDRLGLGERGVNSDADFFTREQPEEVNTPMGFERASTPWEACMTIGDDWPYSIRDTKLKSADELIWILVDVVSRGGNLLLNVGPTPDGEIPAPTIERLEAMGEWISRNGESIYGTSRSPFASLLTGKCTHKGNTLYLHVQGGTTGVVALTGLQNTIEKAWILGTDTPVAFDTKAKTVTLPEALPGGVTTIAIQLDAPAVVQ